MYVFSTQLNHKIILCNIKCDRSFEHAHGRKTATDLQIPSLMAHTAKFGARKSHTHVLNESYLRLSSRGRSLMTSSELSYKELFCSSRVRRTNLCALTLWTLLQLFKALKSCIYTNKNIFQCQTTIARVGDRLEPRATFQGEESPPKEKNRKSQNVNFWIYIPSIGA